MSGLKIADPNFFVQYATNDAIITLYHALRMEQSNFDNTGRLDIPVTLSSLASRFLSKRLGGPRYDLPTKDGLFNIHSLARLFTPKGVELSGGLTEWLGYFLACYKGGRNENFVYGLTEGKIVDVDLKAAYSVGLSMLEYPYYLAKERILECTGESLVAKHGLKLVRSYTTLKIRFEFPPETRFPNLPVRLGLGSVIFPLRGEGYCTGIELYFAVTQLKCKVSVEEGVLIPFMTDKEYIDGQKERRIGKDQALSQPQPQSQNDKPEIKIKDVVAGFKESYERVGEIDKSVGVNQELLRK